MITIDWTPRNITEWRHMLLAAPRGNWFQTLTLGKALRDLYHKNTRVGAIRHDGKLAGVVHIQEINIGPFQLVEIFRGPIWFYDNPPLEWLDEFARLIASDYPRKLFRRRRWLPEWPDSEQVRSVLRKHGFKPSKHFYETVWLDLTKPEDELRSGLHAKWRGHLSKGLRSNLDIRVDTDGSSIDAFVEYQEKQRQQLKYQTRGPALLRTELANAATLKELMILWAVIDNEPAAAIAIVMHGNSATYRAGWSFEAGRKNRAHNVLLWDAVVTLKKANYRALDLGGTTPTKGTDGYTAFKKGMGGEVFTTVGVCG
jgi:hypothetical protein